MKKEDTKEVIDLPFDSEEKKRILGVRLLPKEEVESLNKKFLFYSSGGRHYAKALDGTEEFRLRFLIKKIFPNNHKVTVQDEICDPKALRLMLGERAKREVFVYQVIEAKPTC